MATREQCREALRERCKTKQDVIEFTQTWGGGFINAVGPTEKDWLKHNIERIVDLAHRERKLDLLGVKLGLPTDAERDRKAAWWTNARSWIAVVISLVALLVSILVAIHR